MAAGLTVTVTVKATPLQLPEVGVTLYVAVSAEAAVLVRMPFRVLWPVPDDPPDRSPASVGALHA
jgi:hypothetical protein